MEMTMQLAIDCSDPQRMVTFWALALGYVPEPAPGGHSAWRAYWEATGVPAEELPTGAGDIPDSIVDPAGRGPRVWFQQVPEPKTAENRWHFDLKSMAAVTSRWTSAQGGSGPRWTGWWRPAPSC